MITKLKTIILAYLEKDDLREQMEKIFEEDKEVKYAYELLKSAELFDNNQAVVNERKKDLICELYDKIQAAAGAIWILDGGASMNDEHIEKMKGYVDSGRINNKPRRE